jgi:sugar (pentulose or hexulose) kinase
VTLFVGLDLGTSGARCLVVDESGSRVAAASRPWTYRSPGLGAYELDSAEAWTAVVEATHEALADVEADRLGAVGITSQRTGVVFLDEAGTELLISPNADGRGVGPGMEFEREHGELVYRTAGRLPVMLYLPARLAALNLADPERANRIAQVLSVSDWAVRKLTGVGATEPTQAAEMLVYDLVSGAWSDALCSLLEVLSSLLPEINPAGHTAGTVTREAAWELWLPAGLPTVAGGSDTQAAALAMGVTEPGQAVVVAGSTMLCDQPMVEPTIDAAKRLWTSPHLSGGFVAEAHCGEAGIPIQWMADLMGETRAWIDQAASGAEAGSGGLFFLDPSPSMVGDFPLMRAGSLSFPAPLLALARPRRDVARAVLEGIAFAAKAGLEWTQEVAGSADDFAVTGGVARSRTFARILATLVDRPVRVAAEPLGSALGAAIVAAAGAGAHESVRAAADAMADRGDEVEPVPEWAGPTAGAYTGWRERVQRMDDNTMRVGHMIGRA